MNLQEIKRVYGDVYYEEMSILDIVRSCANNRQDSDVIDWVSGVVAIKLDDLLCVDDMGICLSFRLTGIEEGLENVDYKVLGACEESQNIYVYVEGNVGEGRITKYAKDEEIYEVRTIKRIITEENRESEDSNNSVVKYGLELFTYGDNETVKEFVSSTESEVLNVVSKYVKENNLKVVGYLAETHINNNIEVNVSSEFLKELNIYGEDSVFYDMGTVAGTLSDEKNNIFISIEVAGEMHIYDIYGLDEDKGDEYPSFRNQEAVKYIREKYTQHGKDYIDKYIRYDMNNWWEILYGHFDENGTPVITDGLSVVDIGKDEGEIMDDLLNARDEVIALKKNNK